MSDNMVELLPKRPFEFKGSIGQKYLESYIRLLNDKFEWNQSAHGWGDISKGSPGYKSFITKQINDVEKYLGESVKGIFCDVSGGAGNNSLHFAKTAKLTVHCDLDVNSINGVYEKAKRANLKKILFVRCDYLQLPFESNLFDSIICFDSLERGYEHEVRLLNEMLRCLKPHGRFVVDFHSKLRVSCIPFLQNKIENVLYDYAALEKLMIKFDLTSYNISPFGYVPNSIVPHEKFYVFLDDLSRFLLPCVRWIVAGEKN
jgi:ubiquinone/menaquinone biosynthesis C-methylase UbiE